MEIREQKRVEKRVFFNAPICCLETVLRMVDAEAGVIQAWDVNLRAVAGWLDLRSDRGATRPI